MYRRYIIVGVFFFILIGAYFVFFNEKEDKNDYEKYYMSLLDKDSYSEALEGVSLSIVERYNNSKYDYTITLDNVSERQNNVKVLVIDNNCNKDNVRAFPSFGIIDEKNYSLVKDTNNLDNNELKGINLTIGDSEKIEYLLIYYSSNEKEQFVRVKVSNYLG